MAKVEFVYYVSTHKLSTIWANEKRVQRVGTNDAMAAFDNLLDAHNYAWRKNIERGITTYITRDDNALVEKVEIIPNSGGDRHIIIGIEHYDKARKEVTNVVERWNMGVGFHQEEIVWKIGSTQPLIGF